jgi:hypothetical protein
MSYIKNKLSVYDKEILTKIYDALENINIPTTFSNKGIKGHHHVVKKETSQKDARQTSFGLTTYQGKKITLNNVLCKDTFLYKHFFKNF